MRILGVYSIINYLCESLFYSRNHISTSQVLLMVKKEEQGEEKPEAEKTETKGSEGIVTKIKKLFSRGK